MLTIRKFKNQEEILNIIKNPILFACTYGQSNDFNIDGKDFLVIENEKEIVGCFEIRDFTKVCLEAHIFVLPRYWKLSLEVVALGEQWARKNHYKSIITFVPLNCVHMLKFIDRIGYKAAGTISQGIVYKNYLVDLFIFTKSL